MRPRAQVLGMGGEAVVGRSRRLVRGVGARRRSSPRTASPSWSRAGRRAAVAADFVLGGQHIDLVALADVPVLAVLAARGERTSVSSSRSTPRTSRSTCAERDLAIAVTIVAGAAVRGRVVVVVPEDADPDGRREAPGRCGAEVVQDARPRRDAVAAVATASDLVLVPSRPGDRRCIGTPRAIAALPVGCSVAVPTRPRAGAGLVTGTTTLVGSRRTA